MVSGDGEEGRMRMRMREEAKGCLQFRELFPWILCTPLGLRGRLREGSKTLKNKPKDQHAARPTTIHTYNCTLRALCLSIVPTSCSSGQRDRLRRDYSH